MSPLLMLCSPPTLVDYNVSVYLICLGPALADRLGVAGFCLSLLGWLFLLAALLLFARGGYGTRCPALQEEISSHTKAKGAN